MKVKCLKARLRFHFLPLLLLPLLLLMLQQYCNVDTTGIALSPYREAFCDEILLKDVCPQLSQLQKESAIVDLTVKTQDDLLVKVHRVVFAARLPRLQDCICSSTDSTIDWSRFPQSSVEAFTAYLYTGRLEVSTKTVQPIYLLAVSVELEHVRRWCGQFMIQRLNTSNINQIWDFALETGHQDIRLPCLDFMQKHFEAVVETRGFGTLSEDVLSHLVSSDELVVSREEKVVEAIFSWAGSTSNQSNPCLEESVSRLLNLVRWEEVSEQYLAELLSRDRLQPLDNSCTSCYPERLRALFERACSIHRDLSNKETIGNQGRECLQSTENNSALQMNQSHEKRSKKCLFLLGERFSMQDRQWSVQALDPTSGLQKRFPEMNQRNASQLVALNGLVYVIGGQVHSKLSTSVVEFNPKTGRWRRVASNLLARCGHAAAGFGCGIVSCGGWNGRSAVGFAELFLPAKNRWFRLPDLLDARAAHRAVAHEEDGRIFVTGGENEFGHEMDLVEYCTFPVGNFAETSEPHSFLNWRRAAPMNQKRKYHALAYTKGKIVAVGGFIHNREVTRTVEVFSPPDRDNPLGQWTFVRPLDVPYNYPFAIAVDGYLFLFPGTTSQHVQSNPQKTLVTNLLQKTDPNDQIWTNLNRLSTVREANGVIVLPSLFHSRTV